MANPRRTTRRTTASRPRPTPAVAVNVAAPTPQAETPPAKRVDWRAEYSYVVNDLRQLGIVTAGVFALMFLIGFFL